jgi:hypothetical protein
MASLTARRTTPHEVLAHPSRRADRAVVAHRRAGAVEAPQIVRELLAGGRSVVADEPEIDAALAWAREQEGWLDEPAPLYVRDARTT